ncbi:MAG: hypothetical protein LW721_08375 [Flammeovirgaceae bacterium]|jgi:hypothetical protein|nr:hypothetical protein [Flammeovirgaceae bacterium]
MEILISSLGWIGSLLVIGAYGLNSYQKIKSDSLIFQLMNLAGGILLIINSVYKEAYPFTFINTVWVLIAILAIFRIVSKKQIVET